MTPLLFGHLDQSSCRGFWGTCLAFTRISRDGERWPPSLSGHQHYRRPDGSVDHKIYQNPVHINLYLNSRLHCHSSRKRAILAILVLRARALCDKEGLRDHLEVLGTTSRESGHSQRQIQCAMNPPVKIFLSQLRSPLQLPFCHMSGWHTVILAYC